MNIESFKSAEIKKPDQTESFDIDKRINPELTSVESKQGGDSYDIDRRIDSNNEAAEKTEVNEGDVFCEETELFSTKEERIARTPTEKSERGEWTGERGESTFVPKYSYMREDLAKHGLDGIKYKNGIPSFSEISDTTVQIDNMTTERLGLGKNYDQADVATAKKWSEEKRDGKPDWTARDVAEWRSENKMTWHERNDMQTMDLVPCSIHSYFNHIGGVSECRKRDKQEVTFDA